MSDYDDKLGSLEREQALLKQRFEQHQKILERHMSATEKSLDVLAKTIETQKEATDGLRETLKMLQYLMMGGIFTLVSTKFGLFEGLKLLLF